VYEDFFELRERPFSLTPDPRFLCMTPHHREALSNLTYGIASAQAITLLTGEAGTGKTTLLRTALANIGEDTECVVVSNPTLTRAEFVQFLANKFGLSAGAASSKATWLVELEQLLQQRHARGITTALLLDEAQSLSDQLLEEVRLLSNIETDTDKLLPIVLIGQPDLANRINHPSLRQLKQRIALRCELGQFDLPSTASYVASRIRIAGGTPSVVFTREAVGLVHEFSNGIPRTINVICDNALLSGYAANERPVSARTVAEVCRDFQFAAERSTEQASEAVDLAQAVGERPVQTPQVSTPPADIANKPSASADIPPAEAVNYAGRSRRLTFFWSKS
jgi:type II secretory pathway predicted ATPase ExeA